MAGGREGQEEERAVLVNGGRRAGREKERKSERKKETVGDSRKWRKREGKSRREGKGRRKGER